jgi:hypothetical protein
VPAAIVAINSATAKGWVMVNNHVSVACQSDIQFDSITSQLACSGKGLQSVLPHLAVHAAMSNHRNLGH